MPNPRRRRVLLGVSGGIAAYKAAALVRRLRADGHEVRCALTPRASAFVAPLTLEVLSGSPVWGEEYLEANGSGEELHVTAGQWTDALVVAPATASVLARLALGLADDFLTTTALVFSGPVVIAPAMHEAMWNKPSVAGHVATLVDRGARVVGPEEGALASGEVGVGRMAEPDAIAAAVADVLAGPLAGRRVVVGAGPTREPIDPVRFLSNRSSGKMGFALAAEAARRGARTVLVAGPVALPTPAGVRRVDVTTAREMEAALAEEAPGADLVVMAAAVADHRPRSPARSKLKKRDGPPTLELVENPDILAGLAEVAPDARRVGFAAETDALEEEARGKLAAKRVDFLVANDVSRDDVGFESDENEVTVLFREGDPVRLSRRPKRRLAGDLLDLFTAGWEPGE